MGADLIGDVPSVRTNETAGCPHRLRNRRSLILRSSVCRVLGDFRARNSRDEVITDPGPHQDARHIGEHPRDGLGFGVIHDERESATEPKTRFSLPVTVLGRISSSRATSALLMFSQ